MKVLRVAVFAMLIVSVGHAADNALVTSMKTVKCGAPLAKINVLSVLVGPDTSNSDASCMEFTLRTSKVQYRLRPERQMLLPVGSTVRVRIHRKHVMVQADDEKEVRCGVMSMDLLDESGQPIEPREEQEPARFPIYSPHRMPPRIVADEQDRHCLNMQGDVVRCGG